MIIVPREEVASGPKRGKREGGRSLETWHPPCSVIVFERPLLHGTRRVARLVSGLSQSFAPT